MNPPSKRQWLNYLPLAVLVTLLVGFAGIYLLTVWGFSVGSSRGLVEDRGEWPEPIRDLLAQAARKQIDVEPVQMYRIIDFTEKTYYWTMRSSPELVAMMVSKWELKPGTQDELDRFWRLGWPTEFEVGDKHGRQTFLGNYQKPSDNFIVITDESKPVLYGYYYFNF
jgi:hypothetical protein